MELSQRGALWIIATGVIAAALYFLRGPLTQFAMALILWLAIDGLATTIDRRIPFIPRWLALPTALVLVLGLVALIGWVMASAIGFVAAHHVPAVQAPINSYPAPSQARWPGRGWIASVDLCLWGART